MREDKAQSDPKNDKGESHTPLAIDLCDMNVLEGEKNEQYK